MRYAVGGVFPHSKRIALPKLIPKGRKQMDEQEREENAGYE
jgi:hypothetical protein